MERISIKTLQIRADFINATTNHKVSLYLTSGCGTSVNIDGTVYGDIYDKKTDSYHGTSNKEIYKILEQYSREGFENLKGAADKYGITMIMTK